MTAYSGEAGEMYRVTNEKGYGLVELLAVVAVLGMLFAAVGVVYMQSQQMHVRSTSLEDAQAGARAGLDRMASEVRLIGAFWSGATGAGAAITTATATNITFLGDVDGNTLDSLASTANENTLAAPAASGSTVITVSRTIGLDGTPAFVPGGYVYIASGPIREVRQILVGSAIPLAPPFVITLATALQNSYPAGSLVRAVKTVTYAFNAGANTLTRSVNGGAPDIIVDSVSGLTLTYYDGSNPPVATATLSLVRQIDISLIVQEADGSARTLTTRVRPPNLSL